MRASERTRDGRGRYCPEGRVDPGLTKVCSTCGVDKLTSEFHRKAQLSDGLDSQCKTCKRRARADYYRRHKAEENARDAGWRAANPEYDRERWLRFAASETGRAWLRRYWRDRHARKKAATVGSVDLEAVIAEHGMVCHICIGEIEDGDLHFDHVIPLARGGAHAQDNLRPAHASCNASKGARLMAELPPREGVMG